MRRWRSRFRLCGRRGLRPRCGLIRLWTVRFGAIVWLRRSRTIILRRRFSRTICLRTSGRLWQLLRRRRPICRRRIHRTLIIHTLVFRPFRRSRLSSRTIWLIRGQLRNGLPWVNCIRLIRRRWSGLRRAIGIRLAAHRICRTGRDWRGWLAGRRLFDHRTRSRRSRWTQRLQLLPRQGLSGMSGESLLSLCEGKWRRRGRVVRDHLPIHGCGGRRRYVIRGGSVRSKHALPGGGYGG